MTKGLGTVGFLGRRVGKIIGEFSLNKINRFSTEKYKRSNGAQSWKFWAEKQTIPTLSFED